MDTSSDYVEFPTLLVLPNDFPVQDSTGAFHRLDKFFEGLPIHNDVVTVVNSLGEFAYARHDGKFYGPFYDETFARTWLGKYTKMKSRTPVSLYDALIGKVECNGLWMLDWDSVDFGTYEWREIHDTKIYTPGGDQIVYFLRGEMKLPVNAVVYADMSA